MKRPTYVYVAGLTSIPNLAKIGRSYEPVHRISGMRQIYPDLVLVGVWLQGGFVNETALHHWFRNYQFWGEWFLLSPEEITDEINYLAVDCGMPGNILQ